MTKLQKLAKAELQMETLVIIRKQLRVLGVESIDASASTDIFDAVALLMKAGKKIMLAS
jgi:hypothetical protein